ncbi:MAG TPA: DUF1016 N-terminal domain-containing protein, partial [Chitinophagaceae bacterium]|nr:DUF1016 N-terminal domain-containing protein [Chitinophagaceae bacterium]
MAQVNNHLATFKKTFTERFYRHIRLKLSVPVSQANAALITLFWEIGKELHAFVTKEQAVNKKLLLERLATDLVRQYGSYLGADNLQYMQFLFETFPTASEIEDIQYHVSWEHILLLLKIEDKLLRRVYLQYSSAHHLSEADLRDAIKSEVHKTGVAGAQAKTPRRSGAVTALDRALASKAGLTNPFAASHFEAFRQLTEYPAAGEPTAEDEPAPERKEQPLYAAIEGLIERYRKKQ